MKKVIKWSLATLFLVLLTAFVIVDHYVGKPSRELRIMDERYLTTQQGMSYEEVIAIMGPPHRTMLSGGYWDDTLLSAEQSTLIVRSIQYSFPTFFVGVTLEFSFDSKNQLIGRHRYD